MAIMKTWIPIIDLKLKRMLINNILFKYSLRNIRYFVCLATKKLPDKLVVFFC